MVYSQVKMLFTNHIQHKLKHFFRLKCNVVFSKVDCFKPSGCLNQQSDVKHC